MDINLIIIQFFNAIFYASILFLIASGLSLIYGIMKVLNLAHGALYMFGAYIGYTVVIILLGISWYSMVLAYLAALGILFVIGIAMERVFIKRLYGKEEELMLLLTFSFILIFDDVVRAIWGAQYRAFPIIPGGTLQLGNYQLPLYFIFTTILALVCGGLLWWFFNKTVIGKQMRAAAHSIETAGAFGINTDKVFYLAFGLGAALSGLAGSVAVPLYTASPGMGSDALVLSFAVIVIGGMGSILGALVGALIVGFSRVFMAFVYPALEIALIYIIMVAILLIKPVGLFGREEVERR